MRNSEEYEFGELLKLFLKRYGFNQRELSEELKVHRNTISNWVSGNELPKTRGKVEDIADFLHMSLEDTKRLLSAYSRVDVANITHSPIQLWKIPFRRNPFFTGREQILKNLHDAFSEGKTTVALTQTISGLGGIGKTQTAIEYAYRYRDDYHAILWVRAETSETLLSDFVAIADLLKLSERNEQSQRRTVESVKNWLSSHEKWLLILDNVEELTLIHDFIPPGVKGHIILTTRSQFTRGFAQRIDLGQMERDEGILFLLRRGKCIGYNTMLKDVSVIQSIVAENIYQITDGLPLALDQAGAYIEETGCSLSDYHERYQKQGAKLLDLRSGIDGVIIDHPQSVRATFALSFELVERANPIAADLLRFCSFLYPDAIPEEIVTDGATELSQTLQAVLDDPSKFDMAIAELRNYSLLRRDSETKTLTIHRLVQAVLKNEMGEETQRLWAERTVRAVNQVFPEVEFSTWRQCQRCLPHVLACATLVENWNIVTIEAAQLLNRAGYYLTEHADFKEAEPLIEQALAIHKQLVGAEHPETAASLDNLAELYHKKSIYLETQPLLEQALIICQQAVTIYEQQLGPDHLKTASGLNHLALLYDGMGRHEEAELIWQRVKAIYEQQLGFDHPTTATVLDRLGSLYSRQNRNDEAEILFQRALAIDKQKLGFEHPTTTIALSHLAMHYENTGRYDEAEANYYKIVEISKKQPVTLHPDLAHSINHVANFLSRKEKYAETMQLLEYVAAIYEKTKGPFHLDTTDSLHDLAVLSSSEGEITKAESIFKRLLAIYEQQYPSLHSKSVHTLNHLGELCIRQGNKLEAERFLLRALAICEQHLESTHYETANTLKILGEYYKDDNKYHDAELYLQKAIGIYEESWPQYLAMGRLLDNLARVRSFLKNNIETEVLLQRTLAIYQLNLGYDHSDTINVMDRLVLIYKEQLGSEQPETKKVYILNSLATIYIAQGKVIEAEELLHKVRAIYEQFFKQIANNYKLAQPATHNIYQVHRDVIWAIACSPDGLQIVSASQDSDVHVLKALTGKTVSIYRKHSSWVNTVAWSPNGKHIASGSLDSMIYVWEVVSKRTVLTFTSHSGAVYYVAWSPDGAFIASASEDKTVQIWDAITGNRRLVYEQHSDNVNAVSWSPDGEYIASVSNDTTVQVWNAKTGNRLIAYRGHPSHVYSVAWSPNGKFIASSGHDGTVQIWHAFSGERVLVYHGHSASIHCIAWSPDSQFLVSGSDDSSIHIFHAITGVQLFTFHAHSGKVLAVAWSPDGQYIVTGGDDTIVQVWRFSQ